MPERFVATLHGPGASYCNIVIFRVEILDLLCFGFPCCLKMRRAPRDYSMRLRGKDAVIKRSGKKDEGKRMHFHEYKDTHAIPWR